MGSRWNYVHYDMMELIYMYLSTTERMTCHRVCRHWRESLQNPLLWKRVVVLLDIDLLDRDNWLAIPIYSRYVKELKLTWSVPYDRIPWYKQGFERTLDRTSRFMIALKQSKMQLHKFELLSWFDMHHYHYFICCINRFLESQTSLRNLEFHNLNISISHSVSILVSLQTSKSMITHLDISDCYGDRWNTLLLNGPKFVRIYRHVTVLKVDYVVLASGVLDCIGQGEMENLKKLTIFIQNKHRLLNELSNEKWGNVVRTHPTLEVAAIVFDSCCLQYQFFLKSNIPLISLTLQCDGSDDYDGYEYHHTCTIRHILELVLAYYNSTINSLYFFLHNSTENLDALVYKFYNGAPKNSTVKRSLEIVTT